MTNRRKKNENNGKPTKMLLRLRVNGETHEVATEINKTLLEVLREDMNLTGTKHGCELGECGTCAVLVNGQPVLSCLMLGIEAVDSEIVTVEGMMQHGKPHPLQSAFADLGAAQCGYCIPGILLTAKALLDDNSHPTRQEIRQALSGNLCRCTGYYKILESIMAVVDGRVTAAKRPAAEIHEARIQSLYTAEGTHDKKK